MDRVAIVYWSGTGNTKIMAEAMADGVALAGAKPILMSVSNVAVADIIAFDKIALGCPSMGAEVLEESEMEPFMEKLEKENLFSKKIALFGSYDWGDGEWMRDWCERIKKTGATLVGEGLIVQNTPDADGIAECKELGSVIAKS